MNSVMDVWLAEQLAANTPYDKLVRQLIQAGGAETGPAPAAASTPTADTVSDTASVTSPVMYLQSTGGQPANMASSVTRVFLGVRLECAQCHDHPFTQWTQQDFWGIAAFFAGARLAPSAVAAGDADSPLVDTRTTEIADGEGHSYRLNLPWDAEDDEVRVPEDELPRQYFARWLTSAENPHFAATAVNRVWQHLCGSGLTESVDDLDQATAEVRAVILDDLATKFAASQFDLKELVGAICASKYYQQPTAREPLTGHSLSRPLKVLTPEQLFDSLEVALALPISRIDQGPRYNGQRDALVARMEEALSSKPDEFRSGIPQALTLMNGNITAEATDLQRSRTLRAVVNAPFLDLDEKIDTLFLTTLTRLPRDSERERLA